MRAETDTVRMLILSSFSRGISPDLCELFASGLLTKSDLRRAILFDSNERRSRGVEVAISLYLPLLEKYPQDEDLWAIAISQTLSHLILDIGVDLDSAIKIIERSIPDHAVLIRQIALLNDEIHSAIDFQHHNSEFPFLSLPLSIGTPDLEGRPRYELRELLGCGAQGAVYAAVDRVMSEPGRSAMVAIKLIPIKDDESDLSQVIDEARAARQVSHPNVVVSLDAGVFVEHERSYLFIAYEVVEGQTLEHWHDIEHTRSSVCSAVQIVESVARAVIEAHVVGVVHRDIKPNNIIINRKGVAKLTDFGLAARNKRADKDQSEYSGRGSLGFKPPEQYAGRDGSRSPGVDVYALGGLLAWMITGSPPNGDSLYEAIEFLERPSISPRQTISIRLKKYTSNTLAKIILRAIEPDRFRRYRTVQEFADDLNAWLEHRPIRWIHRSRTAQAALHIRSRPFTSSAALLSLITIASLLIWGGQQAASKELAVLEERVTGQESLIGEIRNRFLLVRTVIQSHQSGTPSPDWLPMITMLESLMGPIVFSMDDSNKTLWEDRIEIVQAILDEEKAKGQPLDFETRLWMVAQGVWKFRAELYEESLIDLDESEAWLTAQFSEADRMTRVIRALMLIAQIRINPDSSTLQMSSLKTIQDIDLPRWVRDEIENTQSTAQFSSNE